jgi:acyl-CoA synthetase (AMP-forming)/AMP-acid ligase II
MTEPETLVQLLLDQAERNGSSGYGFLENGEDLAERLTYSELAADALAIACELEATAAPGSRAVLVFPPGLDFLRAYFGALAAGVIPVPVAPPAGELAAWAESFERIVADARPDIICTTSEFLDLKSQTGLHLADGGARWAASDRIRRISSASPARLIRGEDVALIQYTSGSTANPKGVVLQHRHLLANQRAIRHAFQFHPGSSVVSWLPIFHDMGLIGTILQPLYMGIDCWLLSPLHFLEKPIRWLRAITRFGAEVSGGPNFAYDLCVRRVVESDRAALDLSSWRVAFNGAEVVRSSTLDAFAKAFGPVGFRPRAFTPCYGLAEATLLVTSVPADRDPIVIAANRVELEHGALIPVAPQAGGPGMDCKVVSAGPTPPENAVVIAGPDGEALPDGRIGEVWVAGPSVAAGYWRNPGATADTFNARLADGRGPYLRTGDRGCLYGGELFIAGRAKEMLIVRGRNIFPQDIEELAQRDDPRLRGGCGAAFGFDSPAGELPVIVQEVRDGVNDLNQVLVAMRSRVTSGLGIPLAAISLVPARTLPRTTSGKMRRLATRDAYLADRLPVLAHWTMASLMQETQ